MVLLSRSILAPPRYRVLLPLVLLLLLFLLPAQVSVAHRPYDNEYCFRCSHPHLSFGSNPSVVKDTISVQEIKVRSPNSGDSLRNAFSLFVGIDHSYVSDLTILLEVSDRNYTVMDGANLLNTKDLWMFFNDQESSTLSENGKQEEGFPFRYDGNGERVSESNYRGYRFEETLDFKIDTNQGGPTGDYSLYVIDKVPEYDDGQLFTWCVGTKSDNCTISATGGTIYQSKEGSNLYLQKPECAYVLNENGAMPHESCTAPFGESLTSTSSVLFKCDNSGTNNQTIMNRDWFNDDFECTSTPSGSISLTQNDVYEYSCGLNQSEIDYPIGCGLTIQAKVFSTESNCISDEVWYTRNFTIIPNVCVPIGYRRQSYRFDYPYYSWAQSDTDYIPHLDMVVYEGLNCDETILNTYDFDFQSQSCMDAFQSNDDYWYQWIGIYPDPLMQNYQVPITVDNLDKLGQCNYIADGKSGYALATNVCHNFTVNSNPRSVLFNCPSEGADNVTRFTWEDTHGCEGPPSLTVVCEKGTNAESSCGITDIQCRQTEMDECYSYVQKTKVYQNTNYNNNNNNRSVDCDGWSELENVRVMEEVRFLAGITLNKTSVQSSMNGVVSVEFQCMDQPNEPVPSHPQSGSILEETWYPLPNGQIEIYDGSNAEESSMFPYHKIERRFVEGCGAVYNDTDEKHMEYWRTIIDCNNYRTYGIGNTDVYHWDESDQPIYEPNIIEYDTIELNQKCPWYRVGMDDDISMPPLVMNECQSLDRPYESDGIQSWIGTCNATGSFRLRVWFGITDCDDTAASSQDFIYDASDNALLWDNPLKWQYSSDTPTVWSCGDLSLWNFSDISGSDGFDGQLIDRDYCLFNWKMQRAIEARDGRGGDCTAASWGSGTETYDFQAAAGVCYPGSTFDETIGWRRVSVSNVTSDISLIESWSDPNCSKVFSSSATSIYLLDSCESNSYQTSSITIPGGFPDEMYGLLPTEEPTIYPTLMPTLEPTIFPSNPPTGHPSAQPTANPADLPPDITGPPTDAPTRSTQFPSQMPTEMILTTTTTTTSTTSTTTTESPMMNEYNPTMFPVSMESGFPTQSPSVVVIDEPSEDDDGENETIIGGVSDSVAIALISVIGVVIVVCILGCFWLVSQAGYRGREDVGSKRLNKAKKFRRWDTMDARLAKAHLERTDTLEEDAIGKNEVFLPSTDLEMQQPGSQSVILSGHPQTQLTSLVNSNSIDGLSEVSDEPELISGEHTDLGEFPGMVADAIAMSEATLAPTPAGYSAGDTAGSVRPTASTSTTSRTSKGPLSKEDRKAILDRVETKGELEELYQSEGATQTGSNAGEKSGNHDQQQHGDLEEESSSEEAYVAQAAADIAGSSSFRVTAGTAGEEAGEGYVRAYHRESAL